MSSIDERVVIIKFDNDDFEKNVAQSQKTLDKLKDKLKLDGASKGLEAVSATAKSFSFGGIGDAVDSLRSRFSTLGVVGMTVVQNLTNKVADFATKIGGQIISGGIRRAENLEQANFMLEGLFSKLPDKAQKVEEIMNAAQNAVSGTAYGLDEAAKVASQLVASGIQDGERMQFVLSGIAGTAAMTGGSYEELGNIFTTVAGSGRLMTEQLRQFEHRGLNIAATLGEELGHTEAEIREMVTKGKIDFDTFANAMSNAFGEHAQEANKTYSGSLSNVRAALSRLGAKVASPELENLRDIFNVLAPMIDAVSKALQPLIDLLNNGLRKATNRGIEALTTFFLAFGGDTETLIKKTQYMSDEAKQHMKETIYKFGEVQESGGNLFTKLREKITGTSEVVTEAADTMEEQAGRIGMSAEEIDEYANRVIGGEFGTGETRREQLEALGVSFEAVQNRVNELLGCEYRYEVATDAATKSTGKLGSGIEKTAHYAELYGSAVDESTEKVEKTVGPLENFAEGFRNIGRAVKKNLSIIGNSFTRVFSKLNIGGAVQKLSEGFRKFAYNLLINNKEAKGLSVIFDGLFTVIGGAVKILGFVATVIGKLINGFVTLNGWLLEFIGTFKKTNDEAEKSDKLSTLLEALSRAIDHIGDVIVAFKDHVVEVAKAIKQTEGYQKLKKVLDEIFASLKKAAGNTFEKFINLINKFSDSEIKFGNFDNFVESVGKAAGKLADFISAIRDGDGVIDAFKKAFLKKEGEPDDGLLGSLESFTEKVKKIFKGDFKDFDFSGSFTNLKEGLKKAIKENVDESMTDPDGIIENIKSFFTKIAEAIGDIDWTWLLENILKITAVLLALKALAGIAGILVGASRIMNGFADKAFGSGLIKAINQFKSVSLAILALSASLFIIAAIPSDRLETALKVLAGLAGGLVAIGVVFSKTKINSKQLAAFGGSLLLVSTAIGILSVSLLLLSTQDFKSLIGAAVSLSELLIAMSVAAKISKNAATGYLAMSLAIIPLIEVAGVLALLAGYDWKALLGAGTAMSEVIVAVSVAISLLQAASPTAGVTAAIAFSEFIGILTGVLIGLGALTHIDGFSELVTAGAGVFGQVGQGLGLFIGNIIGGIGEGISNALPKMGQNIAEFGGYLKEFMNELSGIDPSSLDGVESLAKAMLIICGTDVLNSITSFIGLGSSSITSFGESLLELAPYLKQYSDAIKGLDSEAVTKSGEAALMLSEFAKNIPNEGGLISKITGENDLAQFAEKLVPFGKAIVEYSKSVSGGIDEEAVAASTRAATLITEFSKTIPNSGGLLGLITGDNDLAEFAEKLIPFGDAISRYSHEVESVDEAAVEASTRAATLISKFSKTIPNSGGLVSLISGDNDLAEFARKLIPFGEALVSFSDSVKGHIDEASVTTATTCAKLITEVAKTVPNTGGLVSKITGDNDLAQFAKKLIPFGSSIAYYSDSVKGKIDEASVSASTRAAKLITDVAKAVPNSGGLLSKITGDNDLGKFAKKLIPFGEGISQYSESVKGKIDEVSVAASTRAAKLVTTVASTVPNSGGLLSKITGDNDLGKFAKKLIPFGEAISQYSDSVKGHIDESSITASTQAAQLITAFASSVPNSGGLASLFTGDNNLADFGKQLKKFGPYIAGFSDSISGVKTGPMITVANTLPSLADSLSLASDSNVSKSNVKSFADSLSTVGERLSEFSTSIASVVTSKIQSVTSIIPSLVSMTEKMAAANTKNVSEYADTLTEVGNKLNTFGSSVSSINTGLISSVASSVAQIATMQSQMQKAGDAVSGSFSSSMSSAASDGVKNLVGGLSKGTGDVSRAAGSLADAAVKAVQNISNDFKTAGSKAGDEFANGIKAAHSSAYLQATALAAQAIKGVSNVASSMQSYGASAGAAFVSGIGTNNYKAWSTANTVAGSAASGASSGIANGDFHGIGSNAVQGMINGFGARYWDLYWKAYNTASAAATAAKKALSEASPSKVFYGIGDFAVQGFINAFSDGDKAVRLASDKLANIVITETKKPFDALQNAIDLNINSNPTITPVLDLSNIQKSAGLIGNMLGRNTPQLALAGAGAFGGFQNMVSARTPQTDNGDVVHAINGLRDSMGNTTFNITVDGSTNPEEFVSDVVRILKNRSRI